MLIYLIERIKQVNYLLNVDEDFGTVIKSEFNSCTNNLSTHFIMNKKYNKAKNLCY